MIFSIYTLSHPSSGEIFYVGCTSNTTNRIQNHSFARAKSLAKYGRIREAKDHYILSQRINPVFHVIEVVHGNIIVALQRESFWISLMLHYGFPLLNKANKSTYSEANFLDHLPNGFLPKVVSKKHGIVDEPISQDSVKQAA